MPVQDLQAVDAIVLRNEEPLWNASDGLVSAPEVPVLAAHLSEARPCLGTRGSGPCGPFVGGDRLLLRVLFGLLGLRILGASGRLGLLVSNFGLLKCTCLIGPQGSL